MINSVVLVLGVQQTDPVIHMNAYILFHFFSHLGYFRLLRVPYAIQYVLDGYQFLKIAMQSGSLSV